MHFFMQVSYISLSLPPFFPHALSPPRYKYLLTKGPGASYSGEDGGIRHPQTRDSKDTQLLVHHLKEGGREGRREGRKELAVRHCMV